jgi:hypothetical protein
MFVEVWRRASTSEADERRTISEAPRTTNGLQNLTLNVKR